MRISAKYQHRMRVAAQSPPVLHLCMAATETLSVRLTPATRRVLADAAPTHDAAGASAMARDILEQWAAEMLVSQTKTSVERTADYLRTHPEGWADDPADFFRDTAE